MTDTACFPELMERLRSGDDAVARAVVDRFARRLFALARRRFDRRLACRVDPEDVVQSAFKSFFTRHRDGTIQLGDWEGLWSVLTLITVRKCVDRVDYLRARRRDVRREVPAGLGQEPSQLTLDRAARPEEAAALAETVEHLLRAVGDDDRPVLELSLEGYTAAEIGLKLGRALRSVQRVRERIRIRLQRYALEGRGEPCTVRRSSAASSPRGATPS